MNLNAPLCLILSDFKGKGQDHRYLSREINFTNN